MARGDFGDFVDWQGAGAVGAAVILLRSAWVEGTVGDVVEVVGLEAG